MSESNLARFSSEPEPVGVVTPVYVSFPRASGGEQRFVAVFCTKNDQTGFIAVEKANADASQPECPCRGEERRFVSFEQRISEGLLTSERNGDYSTLALHVSDILALALRTLARA